MATIQVGDINIYYELHGPKDAPVLVLNNGIIMNAATSWGYQTPDLSRNFRVLQYDCRGQGQSNHPLGPYTMAMHADDLAALLTALNINAAHIAGISYGGEVAQAFAFQYPMKTRSLILADTVSEVLPELRYIVEGWIDALKTGDPMTVFNATIPWNFSPHFVRSNPALMADAQKRYANLDFPAVIRLCECFLEVNFTCILVGEKDLLKGPEYAQILRTAIPHAEYHIIADAGHATCWENAAEFNSIILGFLVKQEGGPM